MPSPPVKPASRRTSSLLALALAAAAVFGTGCTTQQVSPSSSPDMAGMGPLLTVERFLQAANSRDYDAMASLFGTVEGPIRAERTELEVRMDLLAHILQHQDYGIASQGPVPGRQNRTTRVGVDLQIGRDLVPDVGFMVVRSNQGRWLIEEIDTEAITGR